MRIKAVYHNSILNTILYRKIVNISNNSLPKQLYGHTFGISYYIQFIIFILYSIRINTMVFLQTDFHYNFVSVFNTFESLQFLSLCSKTYLFMFLYEEV